MLKCLHCEARYDSNDLEFCSFAVFYFNPEDNPGSFASFVCSNGHSNGVRKRMTEPYVLYEKEWYRGIPGSLTHLCIFDFKRKIWSEFDINNRTYRNPHIFTEYLEQQNQLKSETSASRLEWLKCALRLNICKDVRLLIGTYVKPSEFWKIEESSWCVVQ